MKLIKKLGTYLPIVVKLLTRINAEIDRRNDGDICIARQISNI